MSTPTKALVAILILFGSVESSASASVILSTYPAKQEGSSFTFSSSRFEAIGFRTGPTGPYDVDSVTLRLAGSTTGEVGVGIYGTTLQTYQCGWSISTGYSYCSYNAPGQLVGSVSTKTVGPKNDYTFDFLNVGLQANSLYWVVVQATSQGSFQYFENAYDPSWYDPKTSVSNWASSYKSDTGAKIYDFASSPCGTWAWCPNSKLGIDWQYHSGLDMIAIDGSLSAIPEPASASLIALGMAGLIFVRRRRALQTSWSR
jgi:hypothetical protein